jgi:hypothetical protein
VTDPGDFHGACANAQASLDEYTAKTGHARTSLFAQCFKRLAQESPCIMMGTHSAVGFSET